MNKKYALFFRVLSAVVVFFLLAPTIFVYVLGLGLSLPWVIFQSLNMTLFMIVSGYSLFSLCLLVIYTFKGRSIKEIPSLIWVGVCIGTTVVTYIYFNNKPSPYGVFGQTILGIGPLIVSVAIFIWLVLKEVFRYKKDKINDAGKNNKNL